MRPRSSRSHSTLVPAESITASTPQVVTPSRRQATIGKQPPSPCRSKRGRSSPRWRSSMPPVPKVILASPRCTPPWPMSDDCWSPTSDGDRRRAVERGGRAERRRSSRRRWAASARSMRSASSMRSSQSLPSPRCSAGDAGVGGVGDVQGALGEVPGDPGVDGADAQVAGCGRGRPRRAGGRPWWPTRWGPRRARRPGARGRCRSCGGPASPSAGPTGSPVARSHTMVDARWLAMPTASTGPPSASTARATSSATSAMRGGVELDQPGRRRVGQQLAVLLDGDGGVGPHDGGPQAARARRR